MALTPQSALPRTALKLSCMRPVQAELLTRVASNDSISTSDVEVHACMMRAMGQMYGEPLCGPPMPAPAVPLKNQGLTSLSTAARVAWYSESDTSQKP